VRPVVRRSTFLPDHSVPDNRFILQRKTSILPKDSSEAQKEALEGMSNPEVEALILLNALHDVIDHPKCATHDRVKGAT
jgi:hypothetical protein